MSTLYLIATPIGNLGDMTARARECLSQLDVLACEDTRHTGNLLKLLDIPRPPVLLSNHEFNERSMAPRLVEYLNAGKKVGICSDAGYPLVSDPGYPAVVAAIAAGHEISVLPGASAVQPALLMSGLPPSSYLFKGFPPRKPGQRRTFLKQDADSPHTLVFYESPFRIGKLLAEALEVLGDRQAAVCLELTKQFERVSRGLLSALSAEYQDKKIKGEAVIVIAGNKQAKHGPEPEDDADGNDDSDGDA
jgi:16S rRNA (cytidine1402-2'-O)-methyltransferase